MIALDEPKTAEEALARVRAIRAKFESQPTQWQAIRAQARAVREARVELERIVAIATTEPEGEIEPVTTIADTVRAVAIAWNISRIDLLSARRTQHITRARQCIHWLARRFTTASFPVIGLRTGGRDHTTAMHSVQRISRFVELHSLAPETDTVEAWATLFWDAYMDGRLR
jgi:chromosomal replication initiation ATPase DnaA